MCRRDLALWCCALLLVASPAEPRGNSTSDDEQRDSTVRHELAVNLTKDHGDEARPARYNPRENSTRNDNEMRESRASSMADRESNDATENEPRPHSTKDLPLSRGDDRTPTELRVNSEKADGGMNGSREFPKNFTKAAGGDDNSVAQESRGNYARNEAEVKSNSAPGNSTEDANENGALAYKNCDGNACIQICCPIGNRLINDTCVTDEGNYSFPVYTTDNSSQDAGKKLDEVFRLVVNDPCQNERFVLNPADYQEDEYTIFANGTLHQSYYNDSVAPTAYCLAVVNQDQYEVTICFANNSANVPEVGKKLQDIIRATCIMISLPFLLATFVVYTILPELWNMHGYTLRRYVGLLFIAYIVLPMLQLISPEDLSNPVCTGMAFVITFSFLASFFWLNVMCFDIWWTFGGFRSLQGSVKQRERKKFVMYSIYAWGSASILTIVCAIMDFVPSVPKNFIRPQFGESRCWFGSKPAMALYFYGPMGITVVCNICLFISTALKIVRHKKDTAHQLRGSESRRHDDNKQWFNLYLKLFIVMGINWSMEIISWMFTDNTPQYIWYTTDLANTLQGLIIFIIFVWKKKIKRLLLMRFGCQDRDFFSRNSTRSGGHSTVSRTITSTTGVMPLQEKVSPYVQANCRVKSSSDEADP